MVAALASLIERRLFVYDAGKPAPVSSILRSKIGEDLTADVVLVCYISILTKYHNLKTSI